MSETVSKALIDAEDENVKETAKFIQMIDKFFDCLNVTNLNCGRKRKKDFQKPYEKTDDERLKVLVNELQLFKNNLSVIKNFGLDPLSYLNTCVCVQVCVYTVYLHACNCLYCVICSGSLMSLCHT